MIRDGIPSLGQHFLTRNSKTDPKNDGNKCSKTTTNGLPYRSGTLSRGNQLVIVPTQDKLYLADETSVLGLEYGSMARNLILK